MSPQQICARVPLVIGVMQMRTMTSVKQYVNPHITGGLTQ